MAAEVDALRERLARVRGGDVVPAARWRLDLAGALLARLDAHAGPSRQVLLARVAGLLDADGLAGRGERAAPGEAPAPPGGTALAALVAQLQAAQRQRATAVPAGVAGIAAADALQAITMPAGGDAGAASAAAPAEADAADAPMDAAPGFAPLPVLEASRRTWARLRNESQVRHSLEQLDEDSGPLNSGRLVHRALTLMQQCAPGYLVHFVAYVDALSSLDALRAATAPAPRAATPGTGKPRARPRKRREPAAGPG